MLVKFTTQHELNDVKENMSPKTFKKYSRDITKRHEAIVYFKTPKLTKKSRPFDDLTNVKRRLFSPNSVL